MKKQPNVTGHARELGAFLPMRPALRDARLCSKKICQEGNCPSKSKRHSAAYPAQWGLVRTESAQKPRRVDQAERDVHDISAPRRCKRTTRLTDRRAHPIYQCMHTVMLLIRSFANHQKRRVRTLASGASKRNDPTKCRGGGREKEDGRAAKRRGGKALCILSRRETEGQIAECLGSL